MTDVDSIVAGLSEAARTVVKRCGIAYGRQYYPGRIMRPLERRGLFIRMEQKGFQTWWRMTETGLAVRAKLEADNG